MISSLHRFHGTKSLNYTYRNGRSVRTKYFVAKYSPNPRRQDYRAAVVVSKKVDKRATVRNRIRRRIYELVRMELADKLKNTDLIITVIDPGVANLEPTELKTAFKSLVRSIKV